MPIDRGPYSVHIAIALPLVFSLTVVAIFSKKHIEVWADLAAFAVPIHIALCFRNRIVTLGVSTYVAAMIVALIAAILFGI